MNLGLSVVARRAVGGCYLSAPPAYRFLVNLKFGLLRAGVSVAV